MSTPTYKVRVPRSREPRFPPICVACGAPPTRTVPLWSQAIGWWSIVQFGSVVSAALGRRVLVPACDPCGRRLRRERRVRSISEFAVIIVGVVLGMWLFREWDGLPRRLAVLGIALLIAMPYLAWDLMFPAAVDILVTSEYVTFLFTDAAYADRFATENAIVR